MNNVLRAGMGRRLLVIIALLVWPKMGTAQGTRPSPWTFSELFSFSLADYFCENNVAVADFRHSGMKDIALLATHNPPARSKVVLLTNRGNGQFSGSTILEYPGYGYAIQSGDLNNDGWADLVVRESSGGTHVLLNDQHGGFSESWKAGPGYDPVTMADVNNDSFLDLLSGTQTESGGKVEVFLNNGSGTNFTRTWESPLYGESLGTINQLFPARLNNDHSLGIVATEIYSGILVTFTGDGTGSSFTQRDLMYLGERTFGLAVGKVNAENLTDLAVHVGWGQTRVFSVQRDNTLSEIWRSPDLGQAAFNLALADCDRDGFDDLFVGTFGDGALRVYRSRPGGFELAWSGRLAGNGYTGTVADLDDDGYPDLIVGEQNAIRIMRNTIPLSR